MAANDLTRRTAPLEMAPDAFREAGHRLIDAVADFLSSLPSRPVTRDETPSALRALLPAGLPAHGDDPARLLAAVAPLLFDHSLFNGHPRFFGYITASAAPVGALADLLTAAVNPNVGGWQLSPIASEIEGQCVRWIAELLGMPSETEGILVSGGNMAPPELKGLVEADSVAVDPHKWLYAAVEAGCALVRHPGALVDTFSYTPPYYRFDGEEEDPRVNYFERGPQNSRGFRALKVWLALRQAGVEGYRRMIGDDIRLARELHRRVEAEPSLGAWTLGLSVSTFRYVPPDLKPRSEEVGTYLNVRLGEETDRLLRPRRLA
jgi:glutamate/tyrosine decarboxylase-like PLP-dependent enzyme